MMMILLHMKYACAAIINMGMMILVKALPMKSGEESGLNKECHGER